MKHTYKSKNPALKLGMTQKWTPTTLLPPRVYVFLSNIRSWIEKSNTRLGKPIRVYEGPEKMDGKICVLRAYNLGGLRKIASLGRLQEGFIGWKELRRHNAGTGYGYVVLAPILASVMYYAPIGGGVSSEDMTTL